MDVTCIICPNSCRIRVSEGKAGARPIVQGAECAKGIDYAVEELVNPVRVLTSTARIEGAPVRVVPVRTAGPVPKSGIKRCMEEIGRLEVRAPVRAGDILAGNLAGTGVALLATWSIPQAGG